VRIRHLLRPKSEHLLDAQAKSSGNPPCLKDTRHGFAADNSGKMALVHAGPLSQLPQRPSPIIKKLGYDIMNTHGEILLWSTYQVEIPVVYVYSIIVRLTIIDYSCINTPLSTKK